MNKFSFLLLAVFATKGAFAGETGTTFSDSNAVAAVAVAGTGISSSNLSVKAGRSAEYSRSENALGEIAAEFKSQILRDAESLVEHELTQASPNFDSLERF
jgi:hypothetical protein